MNGVFSVGKLIQFIFILLQLADLLLNLLQQLLCLTDGRLLLDFNQLSNLKALQLYRPNQLGEDGVALLGCCTSRTLEGDTEDGTPGKE